MPSRIAPAVADEADAAAASAGPPVTERRSGARAGGAGRRRARPARRRRRRRPSRRACASTPIDRASADEVDRRVVEVHADERAGARPSSPFMPRRSFLRIRYWRLLTTANTTGSCSRGRGPERLRRVHGRAVADDAQHRLAVVSRATRRARPACPSRARRRGRRSSGPARSRGGSRGRRRRW